MLRLDGVCNIDRDFCPEPSRKHHRGPRCTLDCASDLAYAERQFDLRRCEGQEANLFCSETKNSECFVARDIDFAICHNRNQIGIAIIRRVVSCSLISEAVLR